MHRFGFDIGGTKTEVIVLGEDNAILFRERAPTPEGDYDEMLETIERLFEAAHAATSPKDLTIGCAVPGTPEAESGRIKNANTTALIGRRIGPRLAKRLGHPVAVANDANCFALSEARDGAAAGAKCVFGVILGTGVGGGIVIDGKVLDGANRLAGEWGHNPFPFRDQPPQGEQCYCGRIDCIETIVSGPALSRDYEEADGDEITAMEVWVRAEAGDETAKRLTDRYVERLAMALATVVNVVDPDAIVLGGGLSNVDRLHAELPERIAANAFNATADSAPVVVNLLRAKWGDSSGVRGAAWLPTLS